MKLQFNIEEYDRMGGSYRTIVIEGSTMRSCLLEAYDRLGLYEEAEDVIYEEVNEIGHRLSDDELLERMIDQSGDGSDYIFSITNLDNGKIIYDSGEEDNATYYGSMYDDEPTFEEEIEDYKEEDDE